MQFHAMRLNKHIVTGKKNLNISLWFTWVASQFPIFK